MNNEYSGISKPSEALVAYLDRAQAPQTREAIAQGLVDGGYGQDIAEGPYWMLIRAIDYQVAKKRLMEINGLIGKAEWPKKMYAGE